MASHVAIEGIVSEHYRFRYDLGTDVLSVHLDDDHGLVTQGELTPAGDTLMRDQKSGRPVALTVKGFWKREGKGQPADTSPQTRQHIEQFAKDALGLNHKTPPKP